MGSRGNGNGNGQRGTAERPQAQAQDQTLAGLPEFDRLCTKRKNELVTLFFEEKDPEGAYRRMCVLGRQILKKLRDQEVQKGRNPDHIDVYSLMEATVSCMRLDLAPGVEAYFVPYDGVVQLIPGPDGVIKNAYRSGFVRDIRSRWVIDGDEFEYDLGTPGYIKHKATGREPSNKDERWAKMTHAYTIIHTTTGGEVIEVLPKSRIEYYRSLSPTFSRRDNKPFAGSLWDKFPTEAARKAALKQGLKNVPKDWRLAATLRDSDTHEGIQIPDDIWDKIRGGDDLRGAPRAPSPGAAGGDEPKAAPLDLNDRQALLARAIEVGHERQMSLPAPPNEMSNEQLAAFIQGETVPAGGGEAARSAS